MFNKNNRNPDPTHLILLSYVIGDDSLYLLDIEQLNTQTTPSNLIARPLNLQKPCFDILGSCNGLVLANDRFRDLYVVNPTTEKTLKHLVGKHWDTTYGFGYDSSTDDYKIISVPINPVTKFVSMYSLRNNSWRNIPNPPNQLRDHCSPHPGVLLNNNLHFIVHSGLRISIVAFSLVDEKFRVTEFPDYVNRVGGMFALGEKIAVFIYAWRHRHKSIKEFWVMEEYGVTKSWTKLCIIENDNVPDYEFYAKVSSRDILLRSSNVGEISLYNMDERRITSVKVEGCPKDFLVYGTNVESLESLERFR
ncbi:F-box protein CPR1-like [Rutidosis leptorrhynchoides]|uniref:F-box protein CPR1-like n=1 Tax=Rutidosis leptorrhynchoides TaxID=125765 RepID=UPI003A999F19